MKYPTCTSLIKISTNNFADTKCRPSHACLSSLPPLVTKSFTRRFFCTYKKIFRRGLRLLVMRNWPLDPLPGFRLVSSMWFFWLFLLFCSSGPFTEAKCKFPAIFNFGDSNSDTGGFWAAFPAERSPFGMTYFKKPAGRASDGRLVIDFLAQALGLPFLSPYLKSIGSDFRHGANFATAASTVLLPNTSLFVTGISPFSLAIQLNQIKNLKANVLEPNHYGNLPPPNIFSEALYTIDIGQNDFTSNLNAIGIEGVKQYLPQVASQIAWTIKVD